MNTQKPLPDHPSNNQFIDFWQSRYDDRTLPWDLNGPSPHFIEFIECLVRQGENLQTQHPKKHVAVPGAGRAHEAALFARHGYDVTAFDYAPGALQEARTIYGELMPNPLNYVQADIFTLANNPDYSKQFDMVIEHTCFCAIPKKRREDYVIMAAGLLKPGGQLLGVFWEHGEPDGPPFSTTPDEIRKRFGPYFGIQEITPVVQNAGERSGQEYWVRMTRR